MLRRHRIQITVEQQEDEYSSHPTLAAVGRFLFFLLVSWWKR